ncbi:hypothetical protein MRX96_026906 [Rhipicephalus microplus]
MQSALPIGASERRCLFDNSSTESSEFRLARNSCFSESLRCQRVVGSSARVYPRHTRPPYRSLRTSPVYSAVAAAEAFPGVAHIFAYLPASTARSRPITPKRRQALSGSFFSPHILRTPFANLAHRTWAKVFRRAEGRALSAAALFAGCSAVLHRLANTRTHAQERAPRTRWRPQRSRPAARCIIQEREVRAAAASDRAAAARVCTPVWSRRRARVSLVSREDTEGAGGLLKRVSSGAKTGCATSNGVAVPLVISVHSRHGCCGVGDLSSLAH